MSALYTYFEDLFKQSYTLPTIIITVSIAVIITLFQDAKEQKQEQRQQQGENEKDAHEEETSSDAPPKPKAFALPTTPLPPPDWSRTFTSEELAQHDGTDEDKPIYVAIKGTVFDVTTKKAMYGPSGGYHCFSGKDASKALGKSSLKAEDCVADYSDLNEKERKTLDDWYSFFEKRYPIVGKTASA
ncbi:cytochrome b5-like heme/steroid binding domain-containing protein [Mortierella sp. GBAus27b]|nr:cytochrome b5-like heme/steroid binding domain-containing protein [Mortierella sp. GBAus27b]